MHETSQPAPQAGRTATRHLGGAHNVSFCYSADPASCRRPAEMKRLLWLRLLWLRFAPLRHVDNRRLVPRWHAGRRIFPSGELTTRRGLWGDGKCESIECCLLASLPWVSSGQADGEVTETRTGTHLITLGTRGGPIPARDRAQSSNLLIVTDRVARSRELAGIRNDARRQLAGGGTPEAGCQMRICPAGSRRRRRSVVIVVMPVTALALALPPFVLSTAARATGALSTHEPATRHRSKPEPRRRAPVGR